jgi:hypothetical protein
MFCHVRETSAGSRLDEAMAVIPSPERGALVEFGVRSTRMPSVCWGALRRAPNVREPALSGT